MLKIEYDLLCFIEAHPSCTWVDVLNAFDPKSSCNAVDGILSCLRKERLLETSGQPPLCTVRLCSGAYRLLAQYRQQEQERREAAQERRKELELSHIEARKNTLIGGAIGFFSSLAALLIPYVLN